jgi:hypothetical protein
MLVQAGKDGIQKLRGNAMLLKEFKSFKNESHLKDLVAIWNKK